MRNRLVSSVVIAVFFLAAPAARGGGFELAEGFPEAAPGAFGIEIEALPDGRLLVWNGDTVFIQSLPGADSFDPQGSGYAGDPGFMAVSPDGHTVMLGAGYSGNLYRFDVDRPADYTPAALVGTQAHYSGVFLSETMVLVDRAGADSRCDLVILDLTVSPPAIDTVMRKPAAADVPEGGFAASAQLAIDAERKTVYTMSPVYDGSYMVVGNQLKSVSVVALIGAFNSDMPLDWEDDATAVGGPTSYNSGGPAAVMADGTLLIGGFGSVQLVNPATGAITDTVSPAGFDYYGVGCNPYSGDIYPIVADPLDWSMDVVYAPAGALTALPASSAMGLSALAGALIAAGILRRSAA